MKSPYLITGLCLVLAIFLMAGCARLPAVSEPAVVSAPLELRVLEQFHAVQKMSSQQFKSELPALELAYAQTPNTVNRLRLAVTLGFGRCQKCDSGRGLKLFKETLQSDPPDSVAGLAALSIELLELKVRLADKNSALLDQQQQVKQLQQKLDDLTSIEESLHLRK